VAIVYKASLYRWAEEAVRAAYHDHIKPFSTDRITYYATPTESTPDYAAVAGLTGTYATYYARCGAGGSSYLWTTDELTALSQSPIENGDLDDYLRLEPGTCYSRFDCIDDGEGYYYDDDKGQRLDCGWAVGRVYPEAEYGPL
jgi:hypothetical protein